MRVDEQDLVLNPKERLKIVIKNADIDLNQSVPLRRYFRGAAELYRMGTVYQEEGNIEQALVLFTRYVTLILERAPKHPDYKTIGKDERNNYQKNLKHALDLAEKDKKLLAEKFEIEAENLKKGIEEANKLAELAALEQEKNNLNNLTRYENNDTTTDQNVSIQNSDMEPVISDTHSITFPVLPNGPSKPQVPPRVPRPAVAAGGMYDTITPEFDRLTKPVLGDISGLRNIVVPENLPMLFLTLAKKNTERNVETCGILCGKLVGALLNLYSDALPPGSYFNAQNKFLVTHVVVPKQSGTPDSCLTEDEEEIFNFQDKHDLITVGWIHTHPTQTAFLSSVDLHTHCSYQLMLPEAIAIVCSGKFNNYGVFMLTNHGMNEISSCRQSGFHPHTQEPPLFESCPHYGLSTAFNASIVDLR